MAFISPILSSIADYTGSKKGFMKLFTYLGGLSCISLFFFDADSLEFGIIMAMLASIGYSGGIVFYNAYLPEIAEQKDQDKISARGFAMGYIGSVILLALNLVLIIKPEWFGINTATEMGKNLPHTICFLSVGIWWIGFAQITFRNLPSNVYNRKPKGNLLTMGYKELRMVWGQLNERGMIKKFLMAFFFYTMGAQTVMYMAPTFGKEALELPDDILIPTIMVIQLFGIWGAYLFANISEKRGNIAAIRLNVVIWVFVCVFAYLMRGSWIEFQFVFIGACVGMVMGGIQALSRSTYSKMLPETQDHASFFSFYDVMEKLGIVIGMFTFGLIENLTESMRIPILMLGIFFIIGYVILRMVRMNVNSEELNEAAGMAA